MQEIELKFLVPESRLKGLMRQAQVKSSRVTKMAAHYYDTPDQKLAQAGIGLRIRQEGNAWVQTIKAGGDGIAARLEHNATLDNEQVQAMLDNNDLMPDLSIYKDTAIAPALADFKLKKLAKKLTRLYVTDVERTTRLLIEDNSDEVVNSVEMAYDYGKIIHGTDDTQRDAIQEIEFELISGDVDFLFSTAKSWCQSHKLCLSTVTKAERGGLLINGQQYSPVTAADLSALNIDNKISMPAFLRTVMHNCLLQILPNSSAIVAGSQDNEHLLQLSIGIDRLHTALQAFNNFADETNPEWLVILQQTAISLAEYHQFAYLSAHVEPMLQQHGAPMVDWTADIDALKITPTAAISANDFQIMLLELIAFTMSDPSFEPQADKLAINKLEKILAKYHEKLLKAEQDLEDSYGESDIELENEVFIEALHKLHSHLKDLRYISELAAPLYGKKKTKRWLKRTIKAQKALGKQLDMTDYQQHYQSKTSSNSAALYAAGWLNAALIPIENSTEKRLDKFYACSVFW